MNSTRQKIVLFPIPIEELENIIRECVKSEMQKTIPVIKEEEVLITRKEAAKLLGISTTTLSSYCLRGIIEAYRIGSLIRFKKDEVIGCLKQIKTLKYNRN